MTLTGLQRDSEGRKGRTAPCRNQERRRKRGLNLIPVNWNF